MSIFVGVDLGAGSMKVTVIDGNAIVLGQASAPVATSSPRAGWAEQDPAEWRRAMIHAIPAALTLAGVVGTDVTAISFSAGAHSFVLEDAAGKVLRPAMMWMDQRSGDQVNDLKSRAGDMIYQRALNTPSATWTLPQLAWITKNEPEIADATTRLYVAKDWLRNQLSGDWTTDRTDAVGTMLYEVEAEIWSDQLCDLANWNPNTLPPVVESTDVTGVTDGHLAADFGLPAGIPLVAGSSDTAVETLSGGGVAIGNATIKLATAGTVSIVSQAPIKQPTLINYPYVIPGLWYTITGTNNCASAHRHVCELLYGQSDSATLTRMDNDIAATAPGAGGLLFHPYLNGERAPYWEPRLKGDFLGLTFAHERHHMARTVYEGVACSLRDVRDVFSSNDIHFDSARIIGGGAKSATWRQIVADVLNIEIVGAIEPDASFGAAILAGVGTEHFASANEAMALRDGDRERHVPNPDTAALYDDLFALYKQGQAAMAPVNYALDEFQKGLE